MGPIPATIGRETGYMLDRPPVGLTQRARQQFTPMGNLDSTTENHEREKLGEKPCDRVPGEELW